MPFTKSEINLFKKVCELNAIAGMENEVAKFLKVEYEKLGFEIVTDNLGSIFALKKSNVSNAPRVMLDGHMDEIGLMCVGINKNGTIKGAPVGGLYGDTFVAARMLLKNKDGNILEGCTDTYLPHSNEDIKDAGKFVYDFGFKNDEEAKAAGVYIGAMMVAKGDLVTMNNKQRLLAKAFDDRYGIVLGLEVLKQLKDVDLPFDLYVGGSVQEEVGLRGALTSSAKIKPDLAIVLDCSPARDLGKDQGELGGGVLLRYVDREMIAFPELLDFQESVCKKLKIKSQYFSSTGGTNAGAIHKAYDGVLTLTHCICARNIHSQSSIIDADDYHAAKKSLLAMLKQIDSAHIEKWKKARR
ncbi:MAG: M42 family peptidase [Bacilli bacterium]